MGKRRERKRKSAVFQIRFSPEELDELRAESLLDDYSSFAEWIRHALKQHVKRRRKEREQERE